MIHGRSGKVMTFLINHKFFSSFLEKRNKGHNRESNTGLEGHSLSRYQYAVSSFQSRVPCKTRNSKLTTGNYYAIVAIRAKASMDLIDERNTVQQHCGHASITSMDSSFGNSQKHCGHFCLLILLRKIRCQLCLT